MKTIFSAKNTKELQPTENDFLRKEFQLKENDVLRKEHEKSSNRVKPIFSESTKRVPTSRKRFSPKMVPSEWKRFSPKRQWKRAPAYRKRFSPKRIKEFQPNKNDFLRKDDVKSYNRMKAIFSGKTTKRAPIEWKLFSPKWTRKKLQHTGNNFSEKNLKKILIHRKQFCPKRTRKELQPNETDFLRKHEKTSDLPKTVFFQKGSHRIKAIFSEKTTKRAPTCRKRFSAKRRIEFQPSENDFLRKEHEKEL